MTEKPSASSCWQRRPLSQLLKPLNFEQFSSQYFARAPLHLPAADSQRDRFENLFNWEAFNQLLNLGAESSPGIKIFKDKAHYIYKRVPETLSQVMAEIRNGSTVVLDQIDRLDPKLAAFADALSAELATKVMINLYLSSPGIAGFPAHYDTHDFFILQIAGHKRWDIYPSTMYQPLLLPPLLDPKHPGVQPPPPESRLQSLKMSPGDVLYVPKGFWHEALAVDEPSLHLTVGVYASTGVDLMNYLLTEVMERPVFRTPMPLIQQTDLPKRSEQSSPWQGHVQTLKQNLIKLLDDPGLLLRFHQSNISSFERRTAFQFPWMFAHSPADLAHITEYQVAHVPYLLTVYPQGYVELVYAKQRMKFAALAQPLLDHILSSDSFTKAELQARFPEFVWPDVLDVLLPLVQDGLLLPIETNQN